MFHIFYQYIVVCDDIEKAWQVVCTCVHACAVVIAVSVCFVTSFMQSLLSRRLFPYQMIECVCMCVCVCLSLISPRTYFLFRPTRSNSLLNPPYPALNAATTHGSGALFSPLSVTSKVCGSLAETTKKTVRPSSIRSAHETGQRKKRFVTVTFFF